jgi:Cu2+-exporting ATPase
MFGAAAMSLSSFCVISNALRLNLFRIHDASHDKKVKQPTQNASEKKQNMPVKNKEDNPMKKTMKIEGMMCGHCEARVKKALENLPAVEEAVVSHEAGTAVITLKEEVEDALLKKAVEDQDYKVISIQ